jgi:poly(3-hydroxybutyrate) depolymerase
MTKDERRAIQPMIDEVNVPREPKAFKVADNVGFNVMFTNEWEVSVRWGKGHQCDNGKTTVEVAVFDPEENWYTLDDDDNVLVKWEGTNVMGHVTPETLTRILQEVAKQ